MTTSERHQNTQREVAGRTPTHWRRWVVFLILAMGLSWYFFYRMDIRARNSICDRIDAMHGVNCYFMAKLTTNYADLCIDLELTTVDTQTLKQVGAILTADPDRFEQVYIGIRDGILDDAIVESLHVFKNVQGVEFVLDESEAGSKDLVSKLKKLLPRARISVIH